MLLIPLELRSKPPQIRFEPLRPKRRIGTQPEILGKLRERRDQLALRTQKVVAIDLPPIIVSQKVISERYGITQTLETAIHEARVAQIGQSDPSRQISRIPVRPVTIIIIMNRFVQFVTVIDPFLDYLMYVFVGGCFVLLQ